MREFINKRLHIDGRQIPYRLMNAVDYFDAKGIECADNDALLIVNQIMALKQACFLLRHTSHSCGSLADDLFTLKNQLIRTLNVRYNVLFDDDFVENYPGIK